MRGLDFPADIFAATIIISRYSYTTLHLTRIVKLNLTSLCNSLVRILLNFQKSKEIFLISVSRIFDLLSHFHCTYRRCTLHTAHCILHRVQCTEYTVYFYRLHTVTDAETKNKIKIRKLHLF